MIPFPKKKYSIIYADPAWKYRDKRLARGGAENHYSTLSLQEIMKLPVSEIAEDDCALLIWVTWPLLFSKPSHIGCVIHDWGFEYKTCGFIWVKTNKHTETNQGMMFMSDAFKPEDENFWGCGNYTRSNTEPCLLATRGKPMVYNRDVHQLIYHPIMRHSEKPAETRDRIVRLFGDVDRIELFARRRSPGWDTWGNEV
jgi:N6-adenosine-specific RNA methylase IME4